MGRFLAFFGWPSVTAIEHVVADQFREDLLADEIGDGTLGFRVNNGRFISSDVPHVIRVEAQSAQRT